MSEVQSRPATRGRGTTRGGRGGFPSRGGRLSGTTVQMNEEAEQSAAASLEDEGELGQLKKQYANELSTLKELFPDWSDEDLVFALQETGGDVQSTVDRIAEGNVTRFADVKKKTREKSRGKPASAATGDVQATSTRGRGRGGYDSTRGGRGRGGDRGGRGVSRGGRGGAGIAGSTRPTEVPTSIPTTESSAWDSAPASIENAWAASTDATQGEMATATSGPTDGWGSALDSIAQPASAQEVPKSSIIPQGATKSWASMLAASKAPPPALPKTSMVIPPTAAKVPEEISTQGTQSEVTPVQAIFEQETPAEHFETQEEHQLDIEETSVEEPDTHAEDAIEIEPTTDKLTEDNLENLPDVSAPLATETVVSNADPHSTLGSVASFTGSQQPPISRPPVSGYATSAWKATGTQPRSVSYQRRILEQQEAVVMPGKHAVDRAAVQFGSMGLGGEAEGNPLDVDEDREEVETRAQPQQSPPPSQPRAALPPSLHSQPSASALGSIPTPKAAPGLPEPQSQPGPVGNRQSSPGPVGPPATTQSGNQPNLGYDQYGRYASGNFGQDQSAPVQKPYDPFSQQLSYPPSQNEQYSGHSQAPSQGHQQPQSHLSGYPQGPSDYNSQFSGAEQRNNYQSYYGSASSQQAPSAQQDQNLGPQRSTSGYGLGDHGFGGNQTNQSQSRFADAPTSGHTTPNPTAGAQQPAQMHQQSHGQSSHGGGYPYGNPYYGNSYYGSYMNQYPSQYYSQQGYGAPFGGKGGGVYGQPHHAYGMSPQTSYEHSASPANAGGYSSSQGRDSTYSSGLGDYGRSGASQPNQVQPQSSSGSAGYPATLPESYGRSPSGYGAPAQHYGQQHGGSGIDESLKGYGDSKTGPAAALGQPGRTGSAANSASQQGGSFPPPQGGFQGGHLNQLHSNQGSQYGGHLGGLGGHQSSGQGQQGSGGYGNYGGGGFGNNSYGNYGRGGWSGYNH